MGSNNPFLERNSPTFRALAFQNQAESPLNFQVNSGTFISPRRRRTGRLGSKAPVVIPHNPPRKHPHGLAIPSRVVRLHCHVLRAASIPGGRSSWMAAVECRKFHHRANGRTFDAALNQADIRPSRPLSNASRSLRDSALPGNRLGSICTSKPFRYCCTETRGKTVQLLQICSLLFSPDSVYSGRIREMLCGGFGCVF